MVQQSKEPTVQPKVNQVLFLYNIISQSLYNTRRVIPIGNGGRRSLHYPNCHRYPAFCHTTGYDARVWAKDLTWNAGVRARLSASNDCNTYHR